MNKVLSEQQAQDLANLMGCFICCDLDGTVCAFTSKPRCDYDAEQMNWYPVDYECSTLPVHIESDKQWYEQIWEPT